ncbi:unnamed protein product [Cunninghamella blakesleeana]
MLHYICFYKLPTPLVVSSIELTLFYGVVLIVDYVLLRCSRFITLLPYTLTKWFMIVYHLAIPIYIISSSQPLNVLFTAAPIYLVMFTAHLPDIHLNLIQNWIYELATDLKAPNQEGNVRLHALAVLSRGIFKLSFILSILDPYFLYMINDNLMLVLKYPWYHPITLYYNLCLGIKAYCLLGSVDVLLGIEQLISGVRFIDLFNSPLIAQSPRDFWSRRWNMVVRNVFHHQIFSPENNKFAKAEANKKKADDIDDLKKSALIEKKKKDDMNKKKGFWSTNNGRGLKVFFLSGVLHELIIWSTCREITLEQLLFFLIHGVAVMLETNFTRNQRRTGLMARLICIILHLLFINLTARLFLAPFVRHDFLKPLEINYSYL